MDLKVIAASFVAVFFAELADKTQLVGIGLAGKTLKPFSVFIGSVGAYLIITAVSVFVGSLIGKHINPDHLKLIGGSLFLILGVLMLLGKI